MIGEEYPQRELRDTFGGQRQGGISTPVGWLIRNSCKPKWALLAGVMVQKLLEKLRRWYEGETKMHVFDNHPDDPVVMMPLISQERHWTATWARTLVEFYRRNWQWVWGTVIGLASLYAAVLALK